VGEILEDPHIRARHMVEELMHPEYGPLRVLGIPFKLSETPGVVENAPPKFGEHNREVLRGLEFAEEQIKGLEESGVIARGL